MDNYANTPNFPNRAIAIFDMTVLRPNVCVKMGLSLIYYSEEVVKSFLFETQRVSQKLSITVIVKPKRYHPFNSKNYESTLRKLAEKEILNFWILRVGSRV
jgi:hypothetical protein